MSAVPSSAVRTTGEGPTVILVHGTATDAATWLIQHKTLRDLRLVSYHRRGTPAWPVPDVRALDTAIHARDLVEVIGEHGGERPTVCGSSYGGVVVLEAMRTRPELFGRAIICEPPLPPSSDQPAVPADWLSDFERAMAEQGGRAAAELFLRTVLSDQAFEALPRRWQERAKDLWEQIASDVYALANTAHNYRGLAQIEVPTLLLGGANSPPMYRRTLEVLSDALPDARLEIIASAGHMMHADAARRFNLLVTDWARNANDRGRAAVE
ncbi:MAG: alpha/beta hydrolase [Deltaproteobacteria bacterium]|nr:alpha/beta hydrolase [Deltaproteobacteria bacterium]